MGLSESRKKEYLQEHDRLARLFRQDRLGFERERKRLIEEAINGFADASTRERLIALQQDWDRILQKAGSSHNRFVLMKSMFWDQVINSWLPMLQSFQEMGSDPALSRQPRLQLRRVK